MKPDKIYRPYMKMNNLLKIFILLLLISCEGPDTINSIKKDSNGCYYTSIPHGYSFRDYECRYTIGDTIIIDYQRSKYSKH